MKKMNSPKRIYIQLVLIFNKINFQESYMSNEVCLENEPVKFNKLGFMNFYDEASSTRWAKIIANSTICPQIYRGKWEDILIACQYAAEIGLLQSKGPLSCLNSIAVIG